MKTGLSFEDLQAQVARDAATRHDFYAPANSLSLETDALGSQLSTPNGRFKVRPAAHHHLAEYVGIDKRYYEKLREHAPDLLDHNVNHWLSRSNPKSARLIRALGQDARAIVSPRYGLLDNDALLATIAPVAEEIGASVESCDLSEERMIVKLVSPRLTGDVRVGDTVQAGIVVRNSEVRAGAVEVDWFLKRLVCANGMILPGPGGKARRRHVGRVWGDPGDGLIPDSVERAEWESAIWTQLQDSVRQAVQADSFQALLERLSLTTKLHAALSPQQIVERLTEQYRLGDDLQPHVLHHLERDGDLSLWGVVNAVTRTAEDVASYSRATNLEELGGRLAHLTEAQWNRLVSDN